MRRHHSSKGSTHSVMANPHWGPVTIICGTQKKESLQEIYGIKPKTIKEIYEEIKCLDKQA